MGALIYRRFIADNAINNAKIGSDAAIATSKLADGVNFLKRDGSVTFTANQPMGGFIFTDAGNASANGDVPNWGQVQTEIANKLNLYDNKPSVKAATTGNVSIASPGTNAFDTVTLANGDRLLVKDQTNAAENGIYIFNGTSVAMTRAVDMDSWAEVPGAMVAVEGTVGGNTNAGRIYLAAVPTTGTLGTTNITWQHTNNTVAAGYGASNFVTRETPTGTLNGSNTTFTLASTPISNTEEVYVGGLLMQPGAGNDYTISGATITFIVAPLAGEWIAVSYRK